MSSRELDEIDIGILHMLQLDARNNSASDIADAVGVTANTVRNRIQRLTEEGIIEGFTPILDYEQAGFQLQVMMSCTAPVPERRTLAQQALDVEGVIHVRELMTGKHNLQILAVASESEQITEVANQIHDIGLTIEAEELVKNEYTRPFSNFGAHTADP